MSGTPILSRFMLMLAAVFLAVTAAPASAAVEITFHSKELGSTFPHAFIVLEGTLDRSGERISGNYGFTAKTVSPAVLMGSVKGEIISHDGDNYVAKSDRHFSFTLTDAEYDRVIALVDQWRNAPQPSYNLNRRNCVHFVAQVAADLGMRADTTRLMKKPRSYLEALTRANREWLEGRKAIFHRGD